MQDLRKHVHDALKLLGRDNPIESPLAQFHLYKIAQRNNGADARDATRRVLQNGIDQLANDYALEAKILQMHFVEGELVQTIAERLSMAEGTIYNKQGQAITRLAELLQEMEQTAITDYHCALEARLNPPSNTSLVGIETPVAHLVNLLCAPGPPWLIALAGMGGIGKTTLADAVARRAIQGDVFEDIGWVTAQQRTFSATSGLRGVEQPALTADALIRNLIGQFMPTTPLHDAMSIAELQRILCTRLEGRPHLIIVDNLETLADVETLIGTLRDLSNPTKFLLTSRESLFTEADIYHFSVPELTAHMTLGLVRQEAQLRNLPDLLAAGDDDLQPIVETVGGNPLAIRLVVGQTHIHALGDVLENLRAARGQTIENLYTYIYRQAWDALDEIARRTLLVMPLVSSLGGSRDHIVKVSQLEPGDVTNALERLVRLNLVDSRGGLHARRYTIHNLTTTFLHEQVIRWGEGP